MSVPAEIRSPGRAISHIDRGILLERVGKAVPGIIDRLVAAAESGDVSAAKALLNKVLPDLKSVDVSQSGESFNIVIAPRVYVGRGGGSGDRVELPDITVNIGSVEKSAPVEILDVTPVKEDGPPETNYAERRKKGFVE